MFRPLIALALLCVAVYAAADPSLFTITQDPNLASTTNVQLNAPPRYMWGWGPGLAGYCGSTSFQTSGIMWGNWLSSELVRNAAGSELLIAVNDEQAASTMKFPYEEWDYDQNTPQSTNFISWVRGQIDDGYIVVIGVYERLKSGGDADYDHIVPVVGYQKDSSSGAVTGLLFNDLYLNSTRTLSASSDVATRNNCRVTTTPQQPYGYCLPKNVNYGIALQGIVDKNAETFRTTLTMPSWTEPDYGKEDDLNQQPVSFTVSATIYGLTVGTSYTVVRFDSPSTVPTKNFLSGSYTNKWTFTATASTYVLKNFDSFMSDSTIFYRTVKSA